MKKSLLLIVALVASLSAWAQISPIVTVVEQTGVITRTSTLYVGEVMLDGQQSFYYLYSEDLTNSSTVIAAVRDCLADFKGGQYSELTPSIVGELVEKGVAICSNSDYDPMINADWTSAANAGQACLPGKTLTSSSSVNLFETDADFAENCTDLISGNGITIVGDAGETLPVTSVLGVLSSTSTDNSTYTVIDGELVELIDRYLTYSFESVTVIYTKAEFESTVTGDEDINVLQMGDNEVALAEEATVYTFTPTESGAYLLTMNCNASAAVGIIDNEEGIVTSMGCAEVPGQTICAAAMLEAGVTYQVATRLSEGSINSAILNIAKYELAPITLGENEFYSPFGTIFEYPFTPPVSGEYTFRTIGDASFSPSVAVFLGEDVLGYDLANNEDAEFTATLEAGVTYTVRTQVRFCYNASLIHLTVVSPLLAINVPESFEHGTVTSDKVAASIGETVTLTVTPDEGYELENLTVTFTNEDEPSGAPLRLRGGSVELTPGENGTYTFEMPAAPVTVNATFKESTVTGVEDINVATTKRGQRYNLMGQPVGNDYKGIVIENGKKRVIK